MSVYRLHFWWRVLPLEKKVKWSKKVFRISDFLTRKAKKCPTQWQIVSLKNVAICRCFEIAKFYYINEDYILKSKKVWLKKEKSVQHSFADVELKFTGFVVIIFQRSFSLYKYVHKRTNECPKMTDDTIWKYMIELEMLYSKW